MRHNYILLGHTHPSEKTYRDKESVSQFGSVYIYIIDISIDLDLLPRETDRQMYRLLIERIISIKYKLLTECSAGERNRQTDKEIDSSI